jgi:hypothetical protein
LPHSSNQRIAQSITISKLFAERQPNTLSKEPFWDPLIEADIGACVAHGGKVCDAVIGL